MRCTTFHPIEKAGEKKKDYYMIEKDREVSIQENFLKEEVFSDLKDALTHSTLPWYFHTEMTVIDFESTPGFFAHPIYTANVPCSPIYESFIPILAQLDVAVLSRIRINLNNRLPEPYFGMFHSDTAEELEENITPLWTVSILYINTNNGYTELESGEKIESIANRLVTFPSNVKHRSVTQTDEQRRILINFNYLNGMNAARAKDSSSLYIKQREKKKV